MSLESLRETPDRSGPWLLAGITLFWGLNFVTWTTAAQRSQVTSRSVACRSSEWRMSLPGLPRLPDAELWLVVRIDRLDLGERTWATILADMERWQAAGNHVQGLQIDFDAATQGLDRYAAFLADARAHVPRPWRLSITGLMDWSANGDPAALARLKPVIDEVVVQTYQGRSTIPGYDAYFRRMAHFPLPFRVALAEGGAWTPPPGLAREPQFKGYVVFLMPKRLKT